MTRWVKLSLNFELLVNRVMKFLLGQRPINNNISVQLELFRIQETTMLPSMILVSPYFKNATCSSLLVKRRTARKDLRIVLWCDCDCQVSKIH